LGEIYIPGVPVYASRYKLGWGVVGGKNGETTKRKRPLKALKYASKRGKRENGKRGTGHSSEERQPQSAHQQKKKKNASRGEERRMDKKTMIARKMRVKCSKKEKRTDEKSGRNRKVIEEGSI